MANTLHRRQESVRAHRTLLFASSIVTVGQAVALIILSLISDTYCFFITVLMFLLSTVCRCVGLDPGVLYILLHRQD